MNSAMCVERCCAKKSSFEPRLEAAVTPGVTVARPPGLAPYLTTKVDVAVAVLLPLVAVAVSW